MTLYDITRPMSPSLAAWPGDTPYAQRWVMRIDQGAAVNVSALTMSAHTGTHADAPYHYAEDGALLNALPLDIYMGPATLIEIDVAGEILPQHFAGVDLTRIERLLVRTLASLRPDDVWEEQFAYLSVEAAELLGQSQVRLFGTDCPSVDPMTSKTMDAHRALYRGNVVILEGLQLCGVPLGDYELIALPLKAPTDASPVRAVLRTLGATGADLAA